MRLLAKIVPLSYGYLMVILWLSYGKGRERVGKICETETIVVPVRND